ncbi:SHOCT domain-containing protein [Thalassobacillus devorans]|uniref:SHOCT domain-containing protein n=1 Tax=Thalassobacillus devorans TaxID=279813 RepID=UPI000491B6F3|nr:SHOCT domain-containing protein [Thalassobacillus devorans]
MNGGMSGGMGGGFFGFGFIGIIIMLAIIAILVWMMKPSSNGKPKNPSSNKSIDTLKERLARGEISEEEYDRMKRKLNE